MQHQLITTAARPSRAQIEPAALELLSRHSAGLLATARRYSACPEDAEDAYQRGVEILLTKAPTTRESDLLPWLKTVVKHEAFAVRRSSGRALPTEEPLALESNVRPWTDDQAERYEQLRVGAEAMAGLKPQEIRCLLLKAEGLSYNEICAATGWTYTKVNRCLTEGRKAFLKRVAGIESGAECERLAPLISKVADGEASAEEMRTLRPHLKGCLACKATLREYRSTPSRVAGLVPPVFALAGGGHDTGIIARLLERVDALGNVATVKVATIAAAGALAAGGGATVVRHEASPPPRTTATAAGESSRPVAAAATAWAPDPSARAVKAVANQARPAARRQGSASPATMETTTTTAAPAARGSETEFFSGAGSGSAAATQPAEFESSTPSTSGTTDESAVPAEFGP